MAEDAKVIDFDLCEIAWFLGPECEKHIIPRPEYVELADPEGWYAIIRKEV